MALFTSQFAGLNEHQIDMMPQKVLLAPPGLGPPGFHSMQPTAAPPGLSAPVDMFVDASVESNHDGSWDAEMHLWNNIYAATTHAALHDLPRPGKEMIRSGSFSDSDETASTVDTLPGHSNCPATVQGKVVDLLSAALYSGDQEQAHALNCITEQLQTLCKTQQGSLLVQSALEVATGTHLDALLEQLNGIVIEACKSPHGNHVIKKCIDVFGCEKIQFIVDALTTKSVAMARDRFGCRIVQHLVDVCPHKQIAGLIDGLMNDAARLCRHPFANYVMQSVVKHGTHSHHAQVAAAILLDAPEFSRHRFAKHVLRLLVEHCEDTDKARLILASKRPAEFFQ